MSDFIVNIIHRPELAPEYAEKVTGQGKTDDIGRSSLLNESEEIFRFQQDTAHKNGLKTTIQMTYASLFSDRIIEMAKKDHEEYGDEIALSLLGLPCKQFREKYKTRDFCIWMFAMDTKKQIVDEVFERFYEAFGFYPESTGSYYMDAELISYIKEKYPGVKCAVATCWEEGPKAYHTCNNSWYTFMDGGPWNPWIPSKYNTHVPASSKEDDSGIVAIPHLSRDLIACYDGNGSNFGTHPQNVLRGMIYDSKTWEYPYLYNIIDQYRSLEKYNNGYSYNMMFVGPGWLNKLGRWEAPYELLKKSYEDGMAYYGKLKKEGQLTDLTMAEFADYYRKKKTYTEPECALWRDILYGSTKQYFWYLDPDMRVGINLDQGGAIFDLRPYAAKLSIPVGLDTGNPTNASYPFLIQDKYRAGYFTHYAGEGTIKSAKLVRNGQEVDLCLERTKGRYSKQGKDTILTVDPVEAVFEDLTVTLQTVYTFTEGSSEIKIERKILDMTDEVGSVMIDDYFTACYGTNEYSEDMSSLVLAVGKENPESAQTGNQQEAVRRELEYRYLDRKEEMEGADYAEALIPPVNTRVKLLCRDEAATGYIREGYAFSPMFTLGYRKELRKGEVLTTWLRLEKAN
ncbi:MAG: hypothetical protein IJ873_09685 [Lachnospiraceae bacterium]|nr:hypothetical protein [Lachnospiraceae bacterium]